MKYSESDLNQDLIDLIEEKEKYRMQALIYREALETVASDKDMKLSSLDAHDHVEVAQRALKAGDDV